MREMFGRKAVSKIESDEEYESALQFAQGFEPKSETDYGWVIAYADAEYKRLESIGKDLDTKADGFIRYSVLVVSALSLLSAYDFTSLDIGGAKLHVLPAVILMLAGIVSAAKAKLPEMQTLPMATKGAFEYANAYAPAMIARTRCAAMTSAASVGLRLVNEKKGKLIRLAFWIFLGGLSWLAAFPLALSLATSIPTLIHRG